MALESQLTSIGTKYIRPALINGWMNGSPTLTRFKAKGRVLKSLPGGNALQFPFTYRSVGNVTRYNGMMEIPAEERDEITSVTYEWKFIGAQIVYKGTDIAKLSGPTAKVNLVMSKKKNVLDTLQDTVATDIFNVGTNILALDGLRLMVDAAGTYPNSGGVAIADFATWSGNEDSATTTLTRALLTNFILTQSGSLGTQEAATVLIMNASMFGKLHAIVDPQERWESKTNLSVGFKTLTFNGLDIVVDTHCPGSGGGTTDNWLIVLNENRLGFTMHADYDMKMGPVLEPITQDAKMQKVLFGAALWTDERRRQGAFQTINPSL